MTMFYFSTSTANTKIIDIGRSLDNIGLLTLIIEMVKMFGNLLSHTIPKPPLELEFSRAIFNMV